MVKASSVQFLAYFESSISRSFDSRQQVLVDRVWSDREGAVNDSPIDMDAKVYLQDIIVLENHFFATGIGSPVRSHIVQAEPCREAHASFESIASLEGLVAGQSTHPILNRISKLIHRDAGLGYRLHVLPDLAVDFGGFAVVPQKIVVHIVDGGEMADLLGCGTLQVALSVLNELTLRILLIRVQFSERQSRRTGLLWRLRLLLATLSFLVLLGLADLIIGKRQGGLSRVDNIPVLVLILVLALKHAWQETTGHSRLGRVESGNRIPR